MNDAFKDYYARRAREYERIYDKPERQGELAQLRQVLPRILRDREVIEIACGTGYWTQLVALEARAVHGLDASEEVLALARSKPYPRRNVRFERGDAYALDGGVPAEFDAGLAAFWWSHVPLERLPAFLAGFHQRLAPGAVVVFVDNVFAEGSSTPIARRDTHGNTYQRRSLDDDSVHEVLKNYPTEAELRSFLAPFADDLECVWMRYYWYATYRLTPSSARRACP